MNAPPACFILKNNPMSDSIHIKLPDGSSKEVPKGTTALDIAKSISPRLADAALAAKSNGNLSISPGRWKRTRTFAS